MFFLKEYYPVYRPQGILRESAGGGGKKKKKKEGKKRYCIVNQAEFHALGCALGRSTGSSFLIYNTAVLHVCMYVCMVITYSKGKDQPAKVASPPRGQLNREENDFFSLSPFASGNMVSRDRFGSLVRLCSAVSSRVSLLISVLRLNLVLAYGIPPEFRHSCLQSKLPVIFVWFSGVRCCFIVKRCIELTSFLLLCAQINV